MAEKVIVVGGGLSGMSAAHSILQAGGRVLLLDKSSFNGGNSSKATSGINAAGTSTQRALGIEDSPEVFENDTTVSAMKLAKPDLIKTLTHESGPAVEWLKSRFDQDLSVIARLAAHSNPRTHRGKERFPGMAITYNLMERLDEIAATTPERAQVINKAKVTELIQEDSGKVVGVVYEKGGKTYKEYGPVVICTGGFGADFTENSLLSQVSAEWDKLHAWSTDSRAAKQSAGKKVPTPNLLTLPTSNGAHCSGDGIKLCLDAGSDTYDLHCVQVHPTGLVDPEEPDAKVKFLAAEALRGSGGLLLDANGKRFCDELGKRDYVSGRMWLHGNPPYRLCLNSKAAEKISWHCEHYVGRGLMKEMSGKELAAACKTTPAELQKEFDIYNKAAQNPGTDKYDTKFYESVPINVDDHYHVAEVTPLVHYTMGGVAANARSEVLKKGLSGEVIPGLFVAGEALGGVHGENRLGGSSLLDCVVFGRVAGQTAAEYLLDELLKAGPAAGGASMGGINVTIQPDAKAVTVSWGAAGASPTYGPERPPIDDGPAEVDPNQAFYNEGGDDKKAAGGSSKTMTLEDIKAESTDDNCLVVLHGKVYDVQSFLDDHPGGRKAILLYKGKDATKEFDMLHDKNIIDKYAAPMEVATFAPSAKL